MTGDLCSKTTSCYSCRRARRAAWPRHQSLLSFTMVLIIAISGRIIHTWPTSPSYTSTPGLPAPHPHLAYQPLIHTWPTSPSCTPGRATLKHTRWFTACLSSSHQLLLHLRVWACPMIHRA